ncbi:hypothetical protein JOB18_003583 [Solea senegalensis]|uniref:Uncharacterized protein n=1 Tax=Solea senegalensis TaxID=28829 RepID=A0AAV6SDN9_SOLSE|nr:hypothetical protein JOB18_003583 [Solea senegalensis]
MELQRGGERNLAGKPRPQCHRNIVGMLLESCGVSFVAVNPPNPPSALLCSVSRTARSPSGRHVGEQRGRLDVTERG